MQMKNRFWIQAFCVGFTAGVLMMRLTSCGTLVPADRVQQQAIKAQESAAAANSIQAASSYRVAPPSETLRVHTPDQAVAVSGRTQMVAGSTIELIRPAAGEANTQLKTSSSQEAGSKQALTGSDSVQIPLGVKLILIGAGIAAIVGALLLAWKYVSNTAFGAGIKLGDAALANVISHIQARAITSTDPMQNATLASIQAVAENSRGKLNNPKS